MWRALAALAPIIGVAIRGVDRRLQRRLRQAQAFSPDRAVAIADSSPLVRWRVTRLRNAGVIRAAGERYYWSEESWAAYRRARRLRALTVLAVMVIILAFLRWHGLIR